MNEHKIDTEELNATIIGLAIPLTSLGVIYPDRFTALHNLTWFPSNLTFAELMSSSTKRKIR